MESVISIFVFFLFVSTGTGTCKSRYLQAQKIPLCTKQSKSQKLPEQYYFAVKHVFFSIGYIWSSTCMMQIYVWNIPLCLIIKPKNLKKTLGCLISEICSRNNVEGYKCSFSSLQMQDFPTELLWSKDVLKRCGKKMAGNDAEVRMMVILHSNFCKMNACL